MDRDGGEVPEIRKGFVEVPGGSLHYVRQGAGPAVVLLHASPCSARVMASLQAAWSRDFTSFAFDLPGFGMSDLPDSGEITIERIGDMIAAGMRQLGIRQAALYGRHTGASVCLAIARQHPDLAVMLLTDGLPIFANPYSDERLKKYLVPIKPTPDGTHLPWTLFRYRDQHVFWPWDSADIEHRSNADLPDIRFLHRGLVDMIEAAETYAPTYRSAFRYDVLKHIGAIACPAYYGNRPGDSQFKTIPLYPEEADVREISRDPLRAEVEELALLKQHPASSEVPEWQSRFGSDPQIRDYIATRHGVVYGIGAALADVGRPRLYLPEMPGSVDLHRAAVDDLAETGPVLAFDPAGTGNSNPVGKIGLAVWCEQIEDVLDHMGWTGVEIVAQGLSSALAMAFAAVCPERVTGLELRTPPLLSTQEHADFRANPAPDIKPGEDGGYLLRLWMHLRDQELWFPWFDKSHQAICRNAPRISSEELNRRALASLKQADSYARVWDALTEPDLLAVVRSSSHPVRVTLDPLDVFSPTVERYLSTAIRLETHDTGDCQ